MPFVLLFAGIMLLTISIRNQQTPFVNLIKSDFTGQGNFIYWVVGLVIIGAVGYIPKAKPVANMLLALILIALILTRGGVFQQLTNALKSQSQASGGTKTTATNLINTGISAAGTLVQSA